ncbi:MAG: GAF domain-containing protein [Spirochaetes bacterium]|nr:GAF domain-containing protein [Spirochaetota bacterium]
MDILHEKNRSIVLISGKARELITLPQGDEFTIVESADITKAMHSLIDETEHDHTNAVIFLTRDEYPELSNLLGVLGFARVSCQLVIFGGEDFLKSLGSENLRDISEVRTAPLSAAEFTFVVRKTFAVVKDLYLNHALQETYLARLIDTRKDQEDLINMGRALSIEKDQEKLLRLILFLSKRITGADAGSIFLVEHDEEGQKRLRFKYSHTFSRDIRLEERVMPMDKKSISGYVAVTGEVLNIPDAYSLPADTPYSFNPSFDKKHNYRSRSMLTVPMKNHVDEIIGVIQLLNCKEQPEKVSDGTDEAFTIKLETSEDFDRYVVTFDKKYDSLMEAVAGQAAIAIENNRMIMQIQNQFEEFVKASVSAIESRDPATSGHSFRVAEICKAMASAVNVENEGYLGGVSFTDTQIKELELAALLHDFGKVYIDLSVFRKAKKLYPKDFDNLCLRLNYLYRFLELQYTSHEAELMRSIGKEGDAAAALRDFVKEKNEKLQRIKDIKEKLCQMNEPAVMEENPEEVLERIAQEIDEIDCVSVEGDRLCVISPADIMNLSIRRGSLNPMERKEIESHVTHTYCFVSKIPWPPEYKNIPEIALRHHEKLDGTGYPDGLKGRESTLIQSRIMAIADIYDALSASDRPYKKAVPLERVLKIMQEEAEKGILDADLVDLFIRNRIYEKISRDSFREYSLEEPGREKGVSCGF